MVVIDGREASLLTILLRSADSKEVMKNIDPVLSRKLSKPVREALVFYRNSVAKGEITQENYAQKAKEFVGSKVVYRDLVGGIMRWHAHQRETSIKEEVYRKRGEDISRFLKENDSLMIEAGKRGYLDKYVAGRMSRTPPYGV